MSQSPAKLIEQLECYTVKSFVLCSWYTISNYPYLWKICCRLVLSSCHFPLWNVIALRRMLVRTVHSSITWRVWHCQWWQCGPHCAVATPLGMCDTVSCGGVACSVPLLRHLACVTLSVVAVRPAVCCCCATWHVWHCQLWRGGLQCAVAAPLGVCDTVSCGGAACSVVLLRHLACVTLSVVAVWPVVCSCCATWHVCHCQLWRCGLQCAVAALSMQH